MCRGCVALASIDPSNTTQNQTHPRNDGGQFWYDLWRGNSRYQIIYALPWQHVPDKDVPWVCHGNRSHCLDELMYFRPVGFCLFFGLFYYFIWSMDHLDWKQRSEVRIKLKIKLKYPHLFINLREDQG